MTKQIVLTEEEYEDLIKIKKSYDNNCAKISLGKIEEKIFYVFDPNESSNTTMKEVKRSIRFIGEQDLFINSVKEAVDATVKIYEEKLKEEKTLVGHLRRRIQEEEYKSNKNENIKRWVEFTPRIKRLYEREMGTKL